MTVYSGRKATVFFAQGIHDDLATGDARGVLVDGSVGQSDVNHGHACRHSLNPYGVESLL